MRGQPLGHVPVGELHGIPAVRRAEHDEPVPVAGPRAPPAVAAAGRSSVCAMVPQPARRREQRLLGPARARASAADRGYPARAARRAARRSSRQPSSRRRPRATHLRVDLELLRDARARARSAPRPSDARTRRAPRGGAGPRAGPDLPGEPLRRSIPLGAPPHAVTQEVGDGRGLEHLREAVLALDDHRPADRERAERGAPHARGRGRLRRMPGADRASRR